MEQADVADLKSAGGNTVRVRTPSPTPMRFNMNRVLNIVSGFLTIVLYPISMVLGILIGNGTLTHLWQWGFLWALCMGAWAYNFCHIVTVWAEYRWEKEKQFNQKEAESLLQPWMDTQIGEEAAPEKQ